MTMPLSPPQGPLPSIGEVQTENRFPLGLQGNRCVSFGSVFDASLGQNGGQNNDEKLNDWGEPLEGGDGHLGENGTTQTRPRQVQQGTSTFNLGIKPKDPPMFYGRAAEDVTTWVAKVSDFFYLTEATDQ